ncbi:MAG TPA: hypothetical protein PLD10_13235 [Rhodopila sp.]|nr:hypothetical protein [Rhodopila sp.]
MTGLLRALEKWASENDQRMRLVIILIWVALGMIVVVAVLVMALLTMPQTPSR